jgi:hypothetical protein
MDVARLEFMEASLPAAARQRSMIRRVTAVPPWTAPIAFRTTEDRMNFWLIVAAR